MNDNEGLKDNEISACPFCGGEARCDEAEILERLTTGKMVNVFYVKCLCGATIQSFNSAEKAIKAWSTRAELTKERGRVVGLIEKTKEKDTRYESFRHGIYEGQYGIGVVDGLRDMNKRLDQLIKQVNCEEK